MKKPIALFTLLLCAAPAARPEVLETIDAIVNGELILSGEVDEALRIVMNEQGVSLPGDQAEIERRRLLQRMIDDLLIVAEVRDRLNEEQKDEIARRVEQMTNEDMERFRSQFSSPLELAREEERIGMTWDELRRAQYQRNERIYLRETIVPQLIRMDFTEPTEEELERFMQRNPAAAEGESLQIAHVLLRVPPDAPADEAEEIRLMAEAVRSRAEGGENFAQLARRYSEHEESKNNGGVLPPFRRGEFLPEFDQLFELEENQISEPIRTQLGYHVVKVLSRPTAEDRFMEMRRREFTQEWLNGLRRDAKIEIRQDEVLKRQYEEYLNSVNGGTDGDPS